MTEQVESANKPVSPESGQDVNMLAAVKEHALSELDSRRQDELDELLHADPTFALENPELAARLKDKFLKDKKDRIEQIRRSGREPNIGDMFELAVEYFGLIAVVKLAETNHDKPDESLRLKKEFEELLHWLEERGVETPKLSRADSGRWFSVDIVGETKDGPSGHRAILHRTRPLLCAEMSVIGDERQTEPAQLMIVKETVISLPAWLFFEIMSREDGETWTERKKEIIEEYMYGKLGEDDVQRINTAYFSAIVPKSTYDALLGDEESGQ